MITISNHKNIINALEDLIASYKESGDETVLASPDTDKPNEDDEIYKFDLNF